MTEVTLRLDTDRRLLRAAGTSVHYLHIALQAPAATQARAPVDLALVLDRSGSMAGAKWHQARHAALQALGQLTAQDRAAVVVFDHEVDTLLPLAPVMPLTRQMAEQALLGITPRGNTDLGGGWLTGCGLIGQETPGDRLRRCFLVSDGEANAGITDASELGQHAHQLRQLGVVTSTFGVGDHYNEELLGLLADAAGGAFLDIAQAEGIPALIARELGDALDVVCADTQVHLTWEAPLKVEVLGSWPVETGVGALTVGLGDLVSRQTLDLLVAIHFPPGAVDQDCPLSVLVSNLEEPLAEATFRWTWVDSTRRRAQPRQAEVEQRVAMFWAAEARREATQRNRRDDLEGARAVLVQAAGKMRGYGKDNKEVINQAALLLGEVHTYQEMLDPRALKARFFATSSALKGRQADGSRSRGGADA
ncbi:MAG: VWA domain-containing protein [Gammaproteobacteria bacterium]|nr:VWA domain-containing protein [Gammaproteobacteria bacterium]